MFALLLLELGLSSVARALTGIESRNLKCVEKHGVWVTRWVSLGVAEPLGVCAHLPWGWCVYAKLESGHGVVVAFVFVWFFL